MQAKQIVQIGQRGSFLRQGPVEIAASCFGEAFGLSRGVAGGAFGLFRGLVGEAFRQFVQHGDGHSERRTGDHRGQVRRDRADAVGGGVEGAEIADGGVLDPRRAVEEQINGDRNDDQQDGDGDEGKPRRRVARRGR